MILRIKCLNLTQINPSLFGDGRVWGYGYFKVNY